MNGIIVYYECRGEGVPLLFIGGLGSDITHFDALIDWLAARYRVVAFDNRGAGRSDKPRHPYSIELMASDAAALLDMLSIERANVLGISMGGRIALELTLSHPARVSRLVLVSTSAAGRGRVVMSWPMRLLRILAWLGLLRGKYPQPRYAYQLQRQASVSYDAVARLGQVHAPTLILHGQRDVSMPLAAAERVHAGIAGSKLAVFGGGHMFFMLAERQRFLDRVAQFLGG